MHCEVKCKPRLSWYTLHEDHPSPKIKSGKSPPWNSFSGGFGVLSLLFFLVF